MEKFKLFLGSYILGLLIGIKCIMGSSLNNITDMEELASLYRDGAFNSDGTARLESESPRSRLFDKLWSAFSSNTNVNENTYKDALVYALMMQKAKGNPYKQHGLNADMTGFGSTEVYDPESMRKYGKDIDEITRTFSNLWSDYDYQKNSKKYNNMKKDEKIMALLHGVQFLRKMYGSRWDNLNLAAKNQALTNYLESYDPASQMSSMEADMYNGNMYKYRKALGSDNGFDADLRKMARVKEIREKALAKEVLLKQMQEEADKRAAESERIRAENQRKYLERNKRILDHQGR